MVEYMLVMTLLFVMMVVVLVDKPNRRAGR